MVKYDYIFKAIEDYFNKCPATLQAKKIGGTGKWTHSTDEWGNHIDTLSYDDGTVIVFSDEMFNKGIIGYSNTDDGFIARNDSFFDLDIQSDRILEKYGRDDLEDYVFYTNYKMSGFGMCFNEYLRGLINKDEFYDKIETRYGKSSTFLTQGLNGKEIADLLYDNNDWYSGLCETSLNGYGDFITARRVSMLYDNDNINKRIVSDKGYTSSTIAVNDLDMIDSVLHIPSDNAWTIITEYRDGDPANKGLSLDYAEKVIGLQSWSEVLSAPKQKFRRKIIDEKNKVIVQVPYEP